MYPLDCRINFTRFLRFQSKLNGHFSVLLPEQFVLGGELMSTSSFYLIDEWHG